MRDGILDELHHARVSDFVFPGSKLGRPLSNMALDAVLRRAQVDVTTHGFRSSFRDWAGDSTAFTRDVVEAAWRTQSRTRPKRHIAAATR